MTLVLAPELEQRIAKRIESGEYHSPDEFIAYALHLVDEQDAAKQIRLEELRHEIAKGIADIERGDYTDYSSTDEMIESIQAKGNVAPAPERLQATLTISELMGLEPEERDKILAVSMKHFMEYCGDDEELREFDAIDGDDFFDMEDRH